MALGDQEGKDWNGGDGKKLEAKQVARWVGGWWEELEGGQSRDEDPGVISRLVSVHEESSSRTRPTGPGRYTKQNLNKEHIKKW